MSKRITNSAGITLDIEDDTSCPYPPLAMYTRRKTKEWGKNPGRWYYLDPRSGDFFSWCDDPVGKHTADVVQKGGVLVEVKKTTTNSPSVVSKTPDRQRNIEISKRERGTNDEMLWHLKNLEKYMENLNDHFVSLSDRVGVLEQNTETALTILKNVQSILEKETKKDDMDTSHH